MEGIELYQAGRAQGLEGDALKNFIKHPTKKQREAAEREGRKLTFQERTNMSDMAEDAIGFMERMISKGMSWVPGMDSKAFAKFLVRSNMPYVRTPANMLIETLTYVSPTWRSVHPEEAFSRRREVQLRTVRLLWEPWCHRLQWL